MKLKFSALLLLLSLSTQARSVFIYTYDVKNEVFEKAMKLVLDKNAIKPDDMKYIQKNNPCEDVYKDALLHFCLKSGEEAPRIVRQNRQALKNIFGK